MNSPQIDKIVIKTFGELQKNDVIGWIALDERYRIGSALANGDSNFK